MELPENMVTSPDFELNAKIMKEEASVARQVLLRRLALIWIVSGAPLVITLMVIGNIFIKFSTPGDRGSLNAFGVLLALATIIAPAVCLYRLRNSIADVRLEIDIAKEARQSIYRSAQGVDQSLSIHQQYVDASQDSVDAYRSGARRYRRIHNFLQTLIISGSIISASVTSAINQVAWFKIAAPVISMAVGISAGMTGYFKFRERSMNLQITADSIEQERTAIQLLIRRYKDQDPNEALILFAEEVERLKEEQRKREQQLDQPPEGQQNQSGAGG